MKWLLVVLIAWADTPPLSTLQIPVATKELCEQAGDQLRKDLGADVAATAVGHLATGRLEGLSGVITSCVRISN